MNIGLEYHKYWSGVDHDWAVGQRWGTHFKSPVIYFTLKPDMSVQWKHWSPRFYFQLILSFSCTFETFGHNFLFLHLNHSHVCLNTSFCRVLRFSVKGHFACWWITAIPTSVRLPNYFLAVIMIGSLYVVYDATYPRMFTSSSSFVRVLIVKSQVYKRSLLCDWATPTFSNTFLRVANVGKFLEDFRKITFFLVLNGLFSD